MYKKLLSFIPVSNEPSGCLQTFGDCREGQRPRPLGRRKFDVKLFAAGALTCVLAIVLSTSISASAMETSATECQPYEDVDDNYDIVTIEDWEKTEIGEYPIDVHSEIWKQLSASETIAACNMPKEFAGTLTTEELVEYAINYPFLIDILAFNTVSDAMNGFERRSFVFEELFSREDCYDKLIKKYLELDVDYTESISGKNYWSEVFIEAYMGLNYESLSNDQKKTFVEAYGDKFSEKISECQDALFSGVFYSGIEKTMGSIPESAVPESVAAFIADEENDTSPAGSSMFGECGVVILCISIVVLLFCAVLCIFVILKKK